MKYFHEVEFTGVPISEGEQNVSIPYFVSYESDIRNLFLLLVVNNMRVEEGNKLQN